MRILLKDNVQFVKKAQSYGVPKTQQVKGTSARSTLGLERPGHKYIKRENLGGGKYRYIYEQSQGKKAPSDKDTLAMVEDFKMAVSQDKQYKRYAKYFDRSDYSNATKAIAARGEDVTPDSFLSELDNLTQVLGTKVSPYLPVAVAAKEYKTMFNMAGNRTTEYNNKLKGDLDKQQISAASRSDNNLAQLKAAGINEQQLNEFKKNPRKIKDLMDKLKRTYDSFANKG
jgi:hypothetical protein